MLKQCILQDESASSKINGSKQYMNEDQNNKVRDKCMNSDYTKKCKKYKILFYLIL